MSISELYSVARPIWFEGIIAVGIGLMIVASMVATDISFHDNYVGFIIEQCHPDNQSAFCKDIREHLGVGMTDQLEIGNEYWNRLLGQAIELFIILFFIRLGFGFMLWKMHVRKMKLTTLIMAIIWGASASIIFIFGMIDTLYFVFQGIPIPSELPYLDGGLIFQETKAWTGDPLTVEKNDLFLTNALGFGILSVLIIFEAFVFQLRGYGNRHIA